MSAPRKVSFNCECFKRHWSYRQLYMPNRLQEKVSGAPLPTPPHTSPHLPIPSLLHFSTSHSFLHLPIYIYIYMLLPNLPTSSHTSPHLAKPPTPLFPSPCIPTSPHITPHLTPLHTSPHFSTHCNTSPHLPTSCQPQLITHPFLRPLVQGEMSSAMVNESKARLEDVKVDLDQT